ncbi:MAG: hypothetical protein P1S60_09875 [Anaerolineae bacterium]|nr:hypothetical protein [Anaerolineae bacterium]
MKIENKSYRKLSIHWLLILWAVALVGFFSPWISRQPYSAALNWNAYDLYDAVRLLPEIETGALSVRLQTLRAPLLGMAVVLSLHLADSDFILRIVGTLVSCGLAAMTLPPYPMILTAWRTKGWSVPFWWAVAVIAFCAAGLWMLPKLKRYLHWMVPFVAVASAVPAAFTLAKLLPALSVLHDAPVRSGWGCWLMEMALGCYAAAYTLMTTTQPEIARAADSSGDAVQVKARYEAQLMQKSGVVAVGIGQLANEPDPVIVVSVTGDDSPESRADSLEIPRQLDGVPVRIEYIRQPDALPDVD